MSDEPERFVYGHITSVGLVGYGVWCLLTRKIAGSGGVASPVSFRIATAWGLAFISAGFFFWERYFWSRVLSGSWALNLFVVLEVVFLAATIVGLSLAAYWWVIVPVQ